VSKQTPFADRLPKPSKRAAGRTGPAQVPANIRVFGVDLSREERDLIRQRLGAKLGKHAPSIERVSVRVLDVNGPRGGVDKLCRIKVVLTGLPSVLYESRAAFLKDALNDALAGTERILRRSIERRHATPLKEPVRRKPLRPGPREEEPVEEEEEEGP